MTISNNQGVMNPEETGGNRDEQGRFIKGESGNPEGRPAGSGLNLTVLLKEKLEAISKDGKRTYKEKFIESLIHNALEKNDLQAQKIIMNYVDGLPPQSIDMNVRGSINERDKNLLEEALDKINELNKNISPELLQDGTANSVPSDEGSGEDNGSDTGKT